MNIALPLAGVTLVHTVPGFRGFSSLKSDGVLRTGLEVRVTDKQACQLEINKFGDVQFPDHFAACGNRWSNQAVRLIVEKRRSEFHIRFYDTASGFEADSRVNL
jgi:hypothetical protein